ncbi:putative zinc binding dehydrogenase [Clohesyomyces aquaticus]|uniref:Putative zinc binding dehydrogenase n=1 Tax=Clohesyomyces aquaticus TaxID=1231657 RepID=A0A1Y1YYG9_9PLEO|nr:putative zinc binding dehydrogenase [Clohesyomyces aquaticus]
MAIPGVQTALVQTGAIFSGPGLPLTVSESVIIPELPTSHHVLVRVLAVALNPTDHKMVTHFPVSGNQVGCDFCGIVEKTSQSSTSSFPVGTRVCGGTFPYSQTESQSGAFAQWISVDSRLILKVPDSMDDFQGAALGGVGWGTAGLAFYDSEALDLKGSPSKPTTTNEPVLVYGGATASGTMACQLLKLSGYAPIAVTSTASAALAIKHGAVGIAIYTSPNCVQMIKEMANGRPIRKVLDCITSGESAAHSFGAMARTGGRYVCLEELDKALQTRRAIRTKEVMGYEGLGVRVDLGPTPYSRQANRELFDITARVAAEMQRAIDVGSLSPHPVREVPGKWEGIINGLSMLQRGEVRGQKLVVRIAP